MIIEFPENFVGEIEKITIISSPCMDLCPVGGGYEYEQKLTINSSGKVTFTSKEWSNPFPVRISEGRWRKASLPKEQAKELLETIIKPFKDYKFQGFAMDVGSWELTAYNTDGDTFRYIGSLLPDEFEEAEEISYFVRNELMMPDLYVFDGQRGYDRTQYIYLSVRFGDCGKTYYYRTEDVSIQVGDQVVVPVGNDGTERIVDVVKVQQFSEDTVPMPLEKVKTIIEKFVHPIADESGRKMIYCPICEKEIDTEDCYDILYDPLVRNVPGLISEEEINAKSDVCNRCRYHDE